MTIEKRIDLLSQLRTWLAHPDNETWERAARRAESNNPWFTQDNIQQATQAIIEHFLDPRALQDWVNDYAISPQPLDQTVAMVMAGNIPLVGFHDWLCAFIAGYKIQYKCSSKDNVLLPAMMDYLISIHPPLANRIIQVEKLHDFDAIIATGGGTSAVHFEYYFGRYPHIIRRNRNAVAILTGAESQAELTALGHDIFDYFGLGCRSVSKLFIPQDYELKDFFEAIYPHHDIINHNKYKNNYEYTRALYLLAQIPFLTNDFLIVKEDNTLSSRIACIHYQRYEDINSVLQEIEGQKDSIQCVSSHAPLQGWPHIPLGHCQRPKLGDYADHVDTLAFLTQLSS